MWNLATETNTVFVAGCKHIYFCCKIGFFDMKSIKIDSFLGQPQVSIPGTAVFWHGCIDLIFQPQRLPLGSQTEGPDPQDGPRKKKNICFSYTNVLFFRTLFK